MKAFIVLKFTPPIPCKWVVGGNREDYIMPITNNVIITKGAYKDPKDDAYCIVLKYPTRLELTVMDHKPGKNNKLPQYQKQSKNTYCDKSTGEVKEYQKSKNRLQAYSSLMKSLRDLRRYINFNFLGGKSELFITLTYGAEYAGCMYDTEKLYRDFKTFWQRLKFRYDDLEYIAVPEPQETGSWHMHILLKHNLGRPLYIDHKELAYIWRHGAVYVKRLMDSHNLINYFYKGIGYKMLEEPEISYDPKERMVIETYDEPDAWEEEILDDGKDGADENEKFMADILQSHEKFNRFHLYPPGFNLFRKSKGIKKPVAERMTYKEARAMVPDGSGVLGLSTTYVSIENEDGELRQVNAITKVYYKIPKKKECK